MNSYWVAHASAQKIIMRPQNHWKTTVYNVPTASKKKDTNATRLIKTRSNFSKSVMVSVAVSLSSLGASNIHVLEPGVKINGAYYCDVVLRQTLLPDIRTASGSEFFVFQQDSAPSYRAKDSVALQDQETPDFIPPALWPRNSPDLNPVDYTVWSASGTSLSYQDLGHRRTETTHQQWVGRSESRGYCTCCWRVASASTRLCSWWRRTFWAHAVIKMMWCDTCDFFERE